MRTACIGLGSNLGPSLRTLRDAWRELGKHPKIELTALSSPYRTEPVDMDSTHAFVNAVGCLETSLSAEELLDTLLAVEKEFGRVRSPDAAGHEDRTLDLDLLLFDSVVMESPSLVLPHPQMHKRLFTLEPLAEIAAHIEHPLLKRSVAELFAELVQKSDWSGIERITWRD